MLYLLSALSVMYILLMYYISLLLLPPDGFVLCYIGLLLLMLWHFDDDVISPSPGMRRYKNDAGTRSEIESRNANFLEQEFPSIREASRDIDFFEEEDEPAPAQEGVDQGPSSDNGD